jgi:hypothetical protein
MKHQTREFGENRGMWVEVAKMISSQSAAIAPPSE